MNQSQGQIEGQIGNVIHFLDEDTINKIAAGEVVERPASVVKELVENSIDAGARNILVELESDLKYINGIKVVDDGMGMTKEDLLISFKKHATSKIRSIADLKDLKTLGFRGEALSSIAAVSNMTITTKPKGVKAISGYKVEVRNREAINFSEVGAPEGTTVLVEDLFYNTPARKKFLKKISTELARVMKVVIALAFAHNHISFKLISNKREVLATKGTSNLLDTIIYIYGVDFAKKLLAVEGRTRLVGVKGYLSLPSFNRSNAEDIFIFINNRYVYSKEIIGAIKEAYGTLLPRDRYPIAFLKLEIDNLLVDVNVHPTKSQVRLSHEKEVYESIVEIIKNALRRQDLTPKVEVECKEKDRARFNFKKSKSEAVTRSEALNLSESRVTHASVLDVDRKLRQTEEPASGVVERNLLPEMQLLGQLGATYIVAKTKNEELVLIDQHAAHERILYEQISTLRDKDRISQELVTPITLNLDSREKLFIVDCLSFLEEVGFKIEEFSGNTLAVTAVPYVLGKLGEPKVIHDIIADVLNEETKVKHVEKEAIIRIIACRGAIKSGAQCTEHQLQRLLNQLYRVNNPYTCPHGRPVMITLDKAQLDKMFKRNN